MVEVTASGGEPLLQAHVGQGIAVVVFFQDGFFRNETMGWEMYAPAAAPPTPTAW